MGSKLGAALERAVGRADGDRADVIDRLASAAGIDDATVNEILNGTIDCPPENRLSAFARTLGVSLSSLLSAARDDGCMYGDDERQRRLARENRIAELLIERARRCNG